MCGVNDVFIIVDHVAANFCEFVFMFFGACVTRMCVYVFVFLCGFVFTFCSANLCVTMMIVYVYIYIYIYGYSVRDHAIGACVYTHILYMYSCFSDPYKIYNISV